MFARSLLRRGGSLPFPSTCVAQARRSIVTVEPADPAAPIHMAFSQDKARPVSFQKPKNIIILHGLFGSKNNYKTLAKQLNENLRDHIYVCDQRNHGDSVHRKVHDYVSMAGDVNYLIEKHKMRNVVLMGHSMGAKTAMATALLYPDKVDKIIVVDNAPVEAQLDGKFGQYVRAMKDIEKRMFTRRKDADELMAKTEPNEAIRAFLLANLKQKFKDVHTLVFRCNLDNLGKALDNIAGFPFHPDKVRFEKPALFVRGTDSPYVPDETIPVIGQFFPKFRMVDVKAGHWLISENPTAFFEAVKEFLAAEEEESK